VVLLGGCGLSCRAQPPVVCDVGAKGAYVVITRPGKKMTRPGTNAAVASGLAW
jgi:hypothetical protein